MTLYIYLYANVNTFTSQTNNISLKQESKDLTHQREVGGSTRFTGRSRWALITLITSWTTWTITAWATIKTISALKEGSEVYVNCDFTTL